MMEWHLGISLGDSSTLCHAFISCHPDLQNMLWFGELVFTYFSPQMSTAPLGLAGLGVTRGRTPTGLLTPARHRSSHRGVQSGSAQRLSWVTASSKPPRQPKGGFAAVTTLNAIHEGKQELLGLGFLKFHRHQNCFQHQESREEQKQGREGTQAVYTPIGPQRNLLTFQLSPFPAEHRRGTGCTLTFACCF